MNQNIYYLEENKIITSKLLEEIKNKGFTRISIFNEKQKVIGILHAKDLININLKNKTKVSEKMRKNKLSFVLTEDKLDDVLSHMMKNSIHIVMVKSYNKVVGVLTQEDILEEMLQNKIYDEFDKNFK